MGALVLAEIRSAADLSVAWTAGRELPTDVSADVVIDFSVPEGLRRLLTVARCPVVSGTTGLTVETCGVAFLHAANFSLGVAVLARLVAQARAALPTYDAEIVELHHAGKRDAPSGTALRLVEALGGGDLAQGRVSARNPGEIGIHSVRGGDIVGEHTVYLCGHGERVQLGHVATHRGVFAAGAVQCARWIVGKPPGRYSIEDVLAG